MIRCYGCMKEYNEGHVCPYCGYDNDAKPKELYHIMPGTILEGRYIVGRSVGQGGFGITYVAWDLQLERKVAIKEYFPSDFATRVMGDKNLTVYNGEAGEQFEAGLKSFIDEAQRLAKFNGIKGVVDIYDTFISNNTGYIVMEFLSGISVKDMLKANKVIDYPTAKEIIVEMLYILREVHKEGIIHRDIAPDNIYITDSGEFKLLDFGAARYATTIHSKSLSVILKPGYAPEEQYRSHGNQGPWTDIYALAATFYKLITGVTPPESMERRADDKLIAPSKLGIVMPKNDEIALLNALNILPENRIQNAQEFLDALGGKKITRKKERNLHTDTGKMYKFVIPMISLAAFIVITFIVSVQAGIIDTRYWSEKMSANVNLPEGYELVPNEIGMQKDNAIKLLEERGFKVTEGEALYSDYIAEGTVAAQTPGTGAQAEGTEVLLIVSKGAKTANVGLYKNRSASEVVAELKELGFYNVQQKASEENNSISGSVESANVKENTEYKLSQPIIVYVSDGSNYNVDTTKDVSVSNYVGEKIETVRNDLANKKLGITISGYEYSDKYNKDIVISQSPSSGIVKEGSTISFVLSLGKEESLTVPNVVNDNVSTAKETLEAAGFNCSISYEYSSTVKNNLVISQSIKSGTKSKRGTTVSIVVSRGVEITTELVTEISTEQKTEKPTATTETTTKRVEFVLTVDSVELNVGEAYTISGNKAISYSSSSNSNVVSVNGNKIVAKSAGVANITVTSVDGDIDSFNVFVNEISTEKPTETTTQAEASLSVSPSSVTLNAGESTPIDISIVNGTKYHSYNIYSSNKNVANVIGNNITAFEAGSARIVIQLFESSKNSVIDEKVIEVRVNMSEEEKRRIEEERKQQEWEKLRGDN